MNCRWKNNQSWVWLHYTPCNKVVVLCRGLMEIVDKTLNVISLSLMQTLMLLHMLVRSCVPCFVNRNNHWLYRWISLVYTIFLPSFCCFMVEMRIMWVKGVEVMCFELILTVHYITTCQLFDIHKREGCFKQILISFVFP